MALHLSSAAPAWFAVANRGKRSRKVRAVASEGFATLRAEEEEKVKLGGSALKVTKLGIGAWSWGDTSYWNNFQWDGN